jgi:hypothetical protein
MTGIAPVGTPAELVANLQKNSWNWGLSEFCAATGLDAKHQHAKEKFLEFRKLSETLAKFDNTILDIIFSKQEKKQ